MEYKKVIENHPGTISGTAGSKYDDTDFLSKMFTKKPKQGGKQPLGLNRQDSSEVLHKSQSMKMIGELKQNNVTGATLNQASAGPQGSIAARMLARKNGL